MPYWSIFCLYCRGYIVDALLECIPRDKQADPAYRLLLQAQPGAAFAMPNKHPPMKLSREEENFLRHWIFDESHYQDGPGPAKRLQLEHQIAPVQMATIIAAAMPNLEVQAAAAKG